MNENVLCLLFDSVSGEYSSPLCFLNKESAIRYFNQMKGKNVNWTDLILYYVADYDGNLGIIKPLTDKVFLARGVKDE